MPFSNLYSPALLGFQIAICSIGAWCGSQLLAQAEDPVAKLQAEAASSGSSNWGHWGPDPNKYSSWTTHSNRLIPVYTVGGNLDAFKGANSPYRDAEQLQQLYGTLPDRTLHDSATYFDQTNVYDLQQSAVASGKKRILLFVFDGMDWQTTQAAAIAKNGRVPYQQGRGTGLAFQDYRGAETDFGYFVTSPHNEGTPVDVDGQRVTSVGGKMPGGYDAGRGGTTPWTLPPDRQYLIGKGDEPHAYTDSASSATSLCAGIKTYNDAINVDFSGREVQPIARTLQSEGFAVGVVTSVPISHATPACAYANNVSRNDYQDLTRDLLGLPSVFHPGGLPGVDVLIGAGWGETSEKDGGQGKNFVPGNRYVSREDLQSIAEREDRAYTVVQRTRGQKGSDLLSTATRQAKSEGKRLFGFFGVGKGHLPFQTADGNYDPVASVGNPQAAAAEKYTPADVEENVTLAEMTSAALDVLQSRSDRWWLLVEAGDVDWANHSNNIDNSIGAVLSGEAAFEQAIDWIESHGGWDDTLLILTADHGHYFFLTEPQALALGTANDTSP